MSSTLKSMEELNINSESEILRFLSETCGFLKYTCEKQPRVTCINRNMLDILGFPKEDDGELLLLSCDSGRLRPENGKRPGFLWIHRG